ncbi:MAG: hypothetical protein A2821_03955 [Candidatus Magasanikbacteria bacterium RIFCSPHIGHO2_01_FULL_41_23]|uniref:DUF721 domain-containing protein n=1 Tax=Candidatus Magasanikbacteria bacterium RIFCSPLOWO2_01_FULL_40_15 TaxID=1798686 RepID=A0A1F6N3L1_9BACT|nr:MAG: hypothetical protein A2821_03955 [Candidatus Magasanikbacteria bacterium RIFCSPHIGHO2_01_FULL_41_23]OGH66970.1 MAG: hypothetical protein A3C66_00495 [Candidatus Magasanikbacteria bacterium RIFCSPHIGHO2_02_FULL_41_35]OGH74951.1 MAG: hypothetical protein A3F22_02630 [Candidatus Magasanikbacteria bacterium RIFCSPHIGHO2_12_FULL_41_16]OGH78253.1 MAG: hypothetical protein A2983_02265 [Candidatus Magasanikbacteria bacterium RIFCSPLOWO2_01_FULL_40_15]
MTFTPLGDTLKNKIDKNSILGRQLESAGSIEAAETVLREMFGDLANQAKPLFLKNRTLTVSCASSAIAQEIRVNQVKIVENINAKLGKNEVDRIRYLA